MGLLYISGRKQGVMGVENNGIRGAIPACVTIIQLIRVGTVLKKNLLF